MGKVGSVSAFETIQKSLVESGDIGSRYFLLHMHHMFGVKGFYKPIILWRARLGLPLQVVCPIREPIARDISAFFYFYLRRYPEICANADLGELKELFLTDLRPRHPKHKGRRNPIPADEKINEPEYMLTWFDKYFRPLTRIDVYKQPFPIDRKWQIYKRGFTRVLVYRIDLKLSEQTKLISSFLGIKLDAIRLENDSKNKDYVELYPRFRESVKLPERYIRRMHDSRFAQHFWSPQELKAVADKWRDV